MPVAPAACSPWGSLPTRGDHRWPYLALVLEPASVPMRRHVLDRGFDFAGMLITILRFPGQGTQDHVVQAGVDVLVRDGRQEMAHGQVAGEHFVKYHTQRVDIGAMVDLVRPRNCSGAM